MSRLTEVFSLMCSNRKIDRDEGEKVFAVVLGECTNEEFEAFIGDKIKQQLTSERPDWLEALGLLAAVELSSKGKKPTQWFADTVTDFALSMLNHEDFRVRIRAGLVIGATSEHYPNEIVSKAVTPVLELIRSNLTRGDISTNEKAGPPPPVGAHQGTTLLHDTAGWKVLETSVKALQSLMTGSSSIYRELLSEEELELLISCSKHTNRFVRETCLMMLDTLAHIGITSFRICREGCPNPNILKIVDCIRTALCDNWSQVRLAASMTARRFALSLTSLQEKQVYLTPLLPPICINRHYLAEGVRLYNRESWKLITNGEGNALVRSDLGEYIAFYSNQIFADNHAVREASCHCFAELGLTMPEAIIAPYTGKIYECLVFCFKDDSWSVRDTACSALGIHVSSNPSFFEDKLAQIIPLFLGNLADAIPSVRVEAAASLCLVCNRFPDVIETWVKPYLAENLLAVKTQKPEAPSRLEEGPATFSMVKQRLHNDEESHTNQTMYSCGSLAPKMRGGLHSNRGGGGGCTSHSFIRPPHPWELSDGCVCLLGEFASFFNTKSQDKREVLPQNEAAARAIIEQNLVPLAESMRFHGYTMHFHFLQTILDYFNAIVQFVGPRPFKLKYLPLFLEELQYSISQQASPQLRNAAQTCVAGLSKMFGAKVLLAQFTEHCFELKSSVVDAIQSLSTV